MKIPTVDELLRAKSETLGLELISENADLGREIETEHVASPGLAFAGYTERVPRGRLQVLGETEVSFLASQSAQDQDRILESFFGLTIPAVIVPKGLDVPVRLLELAAVHRIPVLRTSLKTSELFRRIQPYLEEHFAPSCTVHGSLADVYGTGLLFIGRSGIGKSECVLDLVERGHRLVADDLVHITRRGNDVLLGRGHELQRHHMEIRGVGIIDIAALFGVRATRQQKRVEVVVKLEDWNDHAKYDRTGLESEETEILGVKLAQVTVPLNPGKNITVIAEVAAMNHLLKIAGVHSAALFDKRLRDEMHSSRAYLEEDYE